MKIKRILIANRGEIARRIIRTAHRMGIETVAVYSDADAQALHVQEATDCYALGGSASADTYLHMQKLLEAAKITGADAVHPGYGFLSENAVFAQAVLDAGLQWIGPPPSAMRALGSKSAAKQLALAHGVPTLPGYCAADQSDARFVEEAALIGYPVMVKACAGGGGRGMRLVHAAAQLPAALHSARVEAAASFASDELLIERALLHPRHVEIQIFADAHGQCIHLGERDCSVQRRHQKIIEESPSPAVNAQLRERMGACAVHLARIAGYTGAGTVEFLLDSDEFYLLEVNARLQVEHPVTELRCGIDLVEWQIRVARDEPLPLQQSEINLQGHALQVRLCAEDIHFVPHAGIVQRFVPPGSRVRFDHAVYEGMQVSPHYDSMLGKLIVHAASRDEAIAALREALAQCVLLGLPSNRHFLMCCLDHPVFRSGCAGIDFLAQHADTIRQSLQKRELLAPVSIGLNALFPCKNKLGLNCSFARPVRLRQAGVLHDIALIQPPATPPAEIVQHGARQWHAQSEGVDVWIEDVSFDPPPPADGRRADADIRAPMNGKVLTMAVSSGSAVHQGDVLLTLESMKLEHAICAPHDGMIEAVLVTVGLQVMPRQILLRFASEEK